MANVRERRWVPRLCQVVKKIIKGCWGCKRLKAQAYTAPPPGLLPRERTEGSTAFEVIGVDLLARSNTANQHVLTTKPIWFCLPVA